MHCLGFWEVFLAKLCVVRLIGYGVGSGVTLERWGKLGRTRCGRVFRLGHGCVCVVSEVAVYEVMPVEVKCTGSVLVV